MADQHMQQEELERRRYIEVLNACGVAAAAEEPLDLDTLAAELELSVEDLEGELETLDAFGLIALRDEPQAPALRRAGRQFLALDGMVPRWQLHFLGGTVDDLNARAALLRAGMVVVEAFRDALLAGEGVAHAAAKIVPPAFSQAVDERIAIDLYAATVALMARLSADEPAGCVAEEVVAVRVIGEGRAWLRQREDEGGLEHDEVETASVEMNELFGLFQDDEVLDLFEMEEPSDAALALHDPVKQQAGYVDQRVQSWFTPFGWTAPTGYLKRR